MFSRSMFLEFYLAPYILVLGLFFKFGSNIKGVLSLDVLINFCYIRKTVRPVLDLYRVSTSF